MSAIVREAPMYASEMFAGTKEFDKVCVCTYVCIRKKNRKNVWKYVCTQHEKSTQNVCKREKNSLMPNLVNTYPPAFEEIGAMGREIKSRPGKVFK
jgi:hypothetical protein